MILVVFLALAAAAFPQPLEERPVWRAFEHFYNLEYDEALKEFEAVAEREPSNPAAHNHLAQVILYREMFRAGALESELVSGSNPFLRRQKMQTPAEVTGRFDAAVAKAMSLAQQRVAGNPKDADAHYALGVAHGLRANYNFLVRKAWMDSLRDTTAARKHHAKAFELRPDFIDARLVEGLHDYVVGSLPWHWKFLGFLAGFNGDREGGIKTLQSVAAKGVINRYDAQVLLAAIYRRERRPAEAIPLLTDLMKRFPRNYLLRLETVQMYADAGDKDSALAVLEQVEKLKRADAPGFSSMPLEKVFYYRGNLLFWYRDFEDALANLRRVTPKAAEMDLATGGMAWLRIGQIHDMKGERARAVEAYRQAMSVAPESDAAREARGYVTSPYRRTG